METPAIHSVLTAWVAGLITSLHCVCMCGPLACAPLGKSHGRGEALQAIGLYHFARIGSYALLGGILGWIGRPAAGLFQSEPARLIPWAFAFLFLIVALGWERWIPLPRFSQGCMVRLQSQQARGFAALLGLVTPFFPCAPLYLALGVALLSNSFQAGFVLMFFFGLGTLPLLALLQMQMARWNIRFTPTTLQRLRRIMALLACVLIVGRAVATEPVLIKKVGCLFCH